MWKWESNPKKKKKAKGTLSLCVCIRIHMCITFNFLILLEKIALFKIAWISLHYWHLKLLLKPSRVMGKTIPRKRVLKTWTFYAECKKRGSNFLRSNGLWHKARTDGQTDLENGHYSTPGRCEEIAAVFTNLMIVIISGHKKSFIFFYLVNGLVFVKSPVVGGRKLASW